MTAIETKVAVLTVQAIFAVLVTPPIVTEAVKAVVSAAMAVGVQVAQAVTSAVVESANVAVTVKPVASGALPLV